MDRVQNLIDNPIAINCRTVEDACKFIELCNKGRDKRLTAKIRFYLKHWKEDYKENICFSLFSDTYGLSDSYINKIKDKHTIVEFNEYFKESRKK